MHSPSWKVEVLLAGSWHGATSVLLSDGRWKIVVDTGLPHEAHQLLESLRQRGLEPRDVDAVINTHFHIDHALNNSLFPRSQIYGAQQSFDWCCSLYSDLFTKPDWEKLILKYYPETHDYENSQANMERLRKFAMRRWDVKRLGETSKFRWLERDALPEGLECLLTSGHVPGHVSLIVHSGDKREIIAGDAVLSRDHDESVITMIPVNREQFARDRARILALGGRIVPGHDQEFGGDADPRPRPLT